MVGRFVFGLSGGFFCVFLGLFLTEISPISIRGLTPTINTLPGQLYGMLLMVLGMPGILGAPHKWAYVFLIGSAPAIIPLVLFWKFPHSPKKVYIKDGNKEEGRKIVMQYQGEDVDIDEIIEHFEREEMLAGQQVNIYKECKYSKKNTLL